MILLPKDLKGGRTAITEALARAKIENIFCLRGAGEN
jgi:hypothetical protein